MDEGTMRDYIDDLKIERAELHERLQRKEARIKHLETEVDRLERLVANNGRG